MDEIDSVVAHHRKSNLLQAMAKHHHHAHLPEGADLFQYALLFGYEWVHGKVEDDVILFPDIAEALRSIPELYCFVGLYDLDSGALLPVRVIAVLTEER